MDNVEFYVINLDKNKDRYTKINESLTNVTTKHTRIRAVDGYDLKNDNFCKEILQCNETLLGTIFSSDHIYDTWVYDGTIDKSFPGLKSNGHYGYKGLTMSNLKCFEQFQRNALKGIEWLCVLEDDAVIDDKVIKSIGNLIKTGNVFDVALLDKRANGRGGTAGMLYHKRIIPHIYKNLHPLSEFSSDWVNERLPNLWDWMLWRYLRTFDVKITNLPIIDSGRYPSTISVPDVVE
jgi:hypothetical protein